MIALKNNVVFLRGIKIMKIKLFTLLAAATVVFASPMINAMDGEEIKEKTEAKTEEADISIKLVTEDGREFDVTKRSIEHLVMVKLMLEDLPPIPDKPIPLPNVDGKTFEIIEKVLKVIDDIEDLEEQKIKITQFFSGNYYDDKTLVDVLLAVNYLDFALLVDEMVRMLPNSLKINEVDSQKRIDEIEKTLMSVSNDMKKLMIVDILPYFRHMLEVSSLMSTKEFNSRTLVEYDNWVISVAFSPDGKYIASGSSDNTIKIWEVKSNKLIKTFEGHDAPVVSVAFSLDGKYIASGSNTIRIWDVKTGNQIKELEGHKYYEVDGVSWSSDGKMLASCSFYHKEIIIWEVETGSPIEIFSLPKCSPSSISWSSDGKMLAFGSYNGKIIILDIEIRKLIKKFEGHTYYKVDGVSWSPDGKMLASCFSDLFGILGGTLIIWDVETGNQIKKLEGHYLIKGVSWSPDGKMIASCSHDKTIRILQLFNDKTWEVLQKVVYKNIKGKLITQLSFGKALELIAAINAKKNDKEFEIKKITDQILIVLIKEPPVITGIIPKTYLQRAKDILKAYLRKPY